MKQHMLAGQRPAACGKCWQLEDAGKQSRRQQENSFLDFKLDQDIAVIQQHCETGQASTVLYQIYLSSLCNQACVTCGSGPSTRWAELERQQGAPLPNRHSIRAEDCGIDFTTAQRITVLGGEPLFEPETWRVLELLRKHDNSQCHVSIITNGSIALDSRQMALLREFENLHLCVSVDGIEARFEYMRWPGKWSVLLRNLDQYRSIVGDSLMISYTISAVNAIYYDETVEWFESQDLAYNHNLVYYPFWCSLPAAPEVIRRQLQHHAFFQDIWQGAARPPQDILAQLHHQDSMKRINFRDYLPELADLLAEFDTGFPDQTHRSTIAIQHDRWTRVDDVPGVGECAHEQK